MKKILVGLLLGLSFGLSGMNLPLFEGAGLEAPSPDITNLLKPGVKNSRNIENESLDNSLELEGSQLVEDSVGVYHVDEEVLESIDRLSGSKRVPEITVEARGKRAKKHKCSYAGCDKEFVSGFNLRRHEILHTGEKHYVCSHEGCEYVATCKDQLGSHENMHRAEKSFVCDWQGCEYASTREVNLRVHERVHTGEKPYKCDWEGCGRAFTQVGNLRRHEILHTGEKPYVCSHEGCNRRFSDPSSLGRHIRTHTGETPYKCEVCEIPFTRLDNLKIHKMKKHPELVN